MRKAGIPGRLPPTWAAAIPFSEIHTGVVPHHPPYVDYLAHLGGQWNMLGNDVAGDCVSVTWANFRRLVTATLTNHTVYPTQDQVWQFYKTQNPGFDPNNGNNNGPGSSFDNGMVIQLALNYLHQHGGPDGVKPVAFARVDAGKPDEVKAAIAILGAVWTGIVVDANNEDEFSREQPWQYIPGVPELGGHSVLTGGFGTTLGLATQLTGDEKFITWADETSFTDGYWANRVEEAWAVIWPEHLGTRGFEKGIDGSKLRQLYRQFTNTDLVLP